MKLRLQEHAPPAQCAYCHSKLHEAVECLSCGAAYHADCARELGQCAVMGCVEQVGEPRFPDSWFGRPKLRRYVWVLLLALPFVLEGLGFFLTEGAAPFYLSIVLAPLQLLAVVIVLAQGMRRP